LVTTATGYAEREAAKAMINDARQAADNPQAEITREPARATTPKSLLMPCMK